MKATTTKPSRPPANASELARALGVSRQLVAYHQKQPGAPAVHLVAAWQEFLSMQGGARLAATYSAEDKAEIGKLKKRLLAAQVVALETENEREAGRLIPLAEVKTQAADALAFVFSETDRCERETPAALAGLEAIECQRVLKKFFCDMRAHSRERFDAVGETEK
jgi:hypothetical protein